MKKAGITVFFSLTLLLIIISVSVYIAPHLGWSVNTVSSGSMEPALRTGSLVIAGPAKPEEIVAGDIIVFRQEYGSMITHRVTGIDEEPLLSFRTQGDANLNPDPFKVPAQNLAGKVLLHIPSAGKITEFMKTTGGFISLVAVPGAVLLAGYILYIRKAIRDNRRQKEDTEI